VGVQDFFEIMGLQELLVLDARWEGSVEKPP
jgi:hypothetical protein